MSPESGSSPVAEEYFGHAHVTRIDSARPRRLVDLRELWAYRELLGALVGRDVRVRYKQTWLGASWALLRPLIAMVVFTMVFGRMAKLPSEGAPYALFVLAGLLPWTYFSATVAAATESLLGSQGMISKIYFPRLIVAVAPLGVAFLDLLVGLFALVAMALYYGAGGPAALALVPVGVLLAVLTSAGTGVALAALAVEFRDVRHLVPFGLQVWLYATPVVYPATLAPEGLRWALYLNPVAGAVEAFRAGFVERPPDFAGIAISGLVALLILAAAVVHFGRVERRFVDIF